MYSVVWPRGRRTEPDGESRFAQRLNTLEGKRIGFLYNFAGQNEIFEAIEKDAAQRYPSSKFFGSELFGIMHGGDERKVIEALPNKLHELEIDAVITGIAL